MTVKRTQMKQALSSTQFPGSFRTHDTSLATSGFCRAITVTATRPLIKKVERL